MNIPGTISHIFPIMFFSSVFKVGEVLTVGERANVRIVGQRSKNVYSVQEVLEGDELEVALKHYELLKRNNILWTIF